MFKKALRNFSKNFPKFFFWIIIFSLTVLPFLWLKNGQMDLGGDLGRLYFYDTGNFLKNFASSYVRPFGTGVAEAEFFLLPFVSLLFVLNLIVKSGTLLISFHNSIKLVVSFLAIYLIIKELIGQKSKKVSWSMAREAAAILSGLFYVFSPSMTANFVRALFSHDQIFLNPLIFYLILKFFIHEKWRYIWLTLFLTVVFAHSFGYAAAPPFFAFYPLAMLFLISYTVLIRKKKIPWKGIIVGFILFLLLHSFHLIPELADLFTPGSNTNTRVFNKESIDQQISYFFGVLPIPKLSLNFFGGISFIIPMLIIIGLLFNSKKQKTLPLTGIFFLITFFLVNAKITNLGVELYKRLFYLPGFSMFRNFYGQWQFVFSFFYALLLGQALFLVFSKLHKLVKIVFLGLVLYLLFNTWPFIKEGGFNKIHHQSDNIKTTFIMDPRYKEMLNHIRSLPYDSKLLIFPFTDSGYQAIHGVENGAFVGRSTIGQLTGKADYAGYPDVRPFSDLFWQLAKEKDYQSFSHLLGLLNIRYIFYNSDLKIYDQTFPGYPYEYTRKYFPQDQKGYQELVKNLTSEKIFEKGPYGLYLIDPVRFLPHFYLPQQAAVYTNDPQLNVYNQGNAFFPNEETAQVPTVFIEEYDCQSLLPKELCQKQTFKLENQLPKISFQKINKTKYRLKISGATHPYLLVFSERFHPRWQVYLSPKESAQKEEVLATYFEDQIKESPHQKIFLDRNPLETLKMKPLPEKCHFVANGYANAWYIKPDDVSENQDYELIIEMTGQRIFYTSLGFSLLVLIGFVFWGLMLFYKKTVHLIQYK